MAARSAVIKTVRFRDSQAWAAWLAANHATSAEVWIKVAKKASGQPSVGYPEVLDLALAWGWIDGQRRALDAVWYLQRFTPRTRRSPWSRINRDKVVAFIAAGLMQPPGLAEVERARADGRWDAAYENQKKSSVPADLLAALARNKRAAAFFAALDAKNRYAVLYRIQSAKKAETRARRIATFVEMLARGEKILR